MHRITISLLLAGLLAAQDKPKKQPPVISTDLQLEMTQVNLDSAREDLEKAQLQIAFDQLKTKIAETEQKKQALVPKLNAACGPEFTPQMDQNNKTAVCAEKAAVPSAKPQPASTQKK